MSDAKSIGDIAFDKWLKRKVAQRMAIQRQRTTPPHKRPDWRSYHGRQQMDPTKGLTEEEIAEAKKRLLQTTPAPVTTRVATGMTGADYARIQAQLDEIVALLQRMLAQLSAPQT